jgi:hypothetical protein
VDLVGRAAGRGLAQLLIGGHEKLRRLGFHHQCKKDNHMGVDFQESVLRAARSSPQPRNLELELEAFARPLLELVLSHTPRSKLDTVNAVFTCPRLSEVWTEMDYVDIEPATTPTVPVQALAPRPHLEPQTRDIPLHL